MCIIWLHVSTNHHKWLPTGIRPVGNFLLPKSWVINMKKLKFYTEIAYFVALVMLGLGTALMAYGDLGISTVVAPSYVLYLYVSKIWPLFSFGVAQYVVQAAILILLMIIMKKAKFFYLLSFGAAIIHGIALDAAMLLTAKLPNNTYLQIVLFIIGVILSCASLALVFGSYLPPQSYELFSKELSHKLNKPVHKMVNLYNFGSLVLAVVLSLALFGKLKGVGIGTLVCVVIYGYLINFFQKAYNKLFYFTDKFPIRKYFEERENK